jgi:hypothetical protein
MLHEEVKLFYSVSIASMTQLQRETPYEKFVGQDSLMTQVHALMQQKC